MTRFRESFATQQLLPPWKAENVRTWCFLFPLRTAAIQTYLDQHFNLVRPDPSPFHFWALRNAQFGVLAVSHYPPPGVWSTNKDNPSRAIGAERWDHLTFTQVYVAIPVNRYRLTVDNLLLDPQRYWIQPLVISDNASVVFSSREIVGIDMMHGDIPSFNSFEPGLDGEPNALHLDALISGFRTFSPDSEEQMLPFLHLQTGTPLPEGRLPDLDPEDRAFLDGFLDAIDQGGASAGAAPFPATTRLVTLKQFRDAYNLMLASYQAIVGSTTTHTNIRSPRFVDKTDVDLEFMWSGTASEILTSFLDIDKPDVDAAPQPHDGPGWNIAGSLVEPRIAFTFTSDVTFDQIETLHTFADVAHGPTNG